MFLFLMFVIYLLLSLLLFDIIITHREITISTGVFVIDLAAIYTIQPPLLPDRLKEGCSFRLIMGVMDAEEEEDYNALGLRFIRWLEGKIHTIQ